jgi:hypothetical protein
MGSYPNLHTTLLGFFLSIGVGNLLLGHPVPKFQNRKMIFLAFSRQEERFSEVGKIGSKVRE